MKLIEVIDLLDLKLKERTASYYLPGEHPTLIETSASPSIPYLIEALKQKKVDLKTIKYVIVTHIHLDHAGGVGQLLTSLPHATVLVHPRGLKHLVDPTQLIKSAKSVYQSEFCALFDPIKPVDKERIRAVSDQETLMISKDRMLTFYDTPGHCLHHLAIFDHLTNSIFTGDTIGVLYPTRLTGGDEVILPSTSPTQFDPAQMLSSLQRIKKIHPNTIYFGHFGKSNNPSHVYDMLEMWLDIFMEKATDIYVSLAAETDDVIVEEISTALLASVKNKITVTDPRLFDYLTIDLKVSSQGVVHYLRRRQAQLSNE